MLSHLRVRDLAIIDEVDIEFGEGFTVITGETGAGKSILIEAITLLMGSRGDTDFIRSGSDELTVEGIFHTESGELLIKRTLNRAGRSKVYINNELSTLNQLKNITAFLIDISGQHQHQMLINEEFHIDIVDRYASLEDSLNEYKRLREELFSLLSELSRIEDLSREKDSRLDFLRYQKGELQDVAVTKEEYENLLNESNRLRHWARFRELLLEAESLINSGEDSIINKLGRARKRLSELSTIDREFEQYIADLDSLNSFLTDLSNSLSKHLLREDYSEERLDYIESKIHRIKRVCEKYRIGVEEIVPRIKKIESEIEELENTEVTSRDIKKRIESVFSALREKAEALHRARSKASLQISTRCEEILSKLGFKKAGIKFDIIYEPPSDVSEKEKILEKGFDRVRILFAPNIGEEPRPLSKIASGGELSRVMLAFKSALLGKDMIGTYIFDEVDAGIGGAVAESVGRFLKELSKNRQVICITHLPQIASLASEHFRVEKLIQHKRTIMQIKKIREDERVEEIARMLGGHTITEKNLAYARELLNRDR